VGSTAILDTAVVKRKIPTLKTRVRLFVMQFGGSLQYSDVDHNELFRGVRPVRILVTCRTMF